MNNLICLVKYFWQFVELFKFLFFQNWQHFLGYRKPVKTLKLIMLIWVISVFNKIHKNQKQVLNYNFAKSLPPNVFRIPQKGTVPERWGWAHCRRVQHFLWRRAGRRIHPPRLTEQSSRSIPVWSAPPGWSWTAVPGTVPIRRNVVIFSIGFFCKFVSIWIIPSELSNYSVPDKK